MACRHWGEAFLLLALAAVVGLSGEGGSLAAPDLYPGAEEVNVYWMSGVINNGRACVGSLGLHGHDAYDLIADNFADPPADPCSDGGVTAAVDLRTYGRASVEHVTLHATMHSGEYTDGCDYIEARTVQEPSGEDRGMYRYIHARGTTGQQVDIRAGRVVLLSTDAPIGSTTKDDNCQGGWTGYHTHQDSGNPTSQWSGPNLQLPINDDIPVWDASYFIHSWIYPLPDTDGDWFTDAAEVYLGTDRLDRCPDSTSDAAWPLDINNDRAITVPGDVLKYAGRIGAGPGDPGWWQRLDLNTDGGITVPGDVMKYAGKLGQECYN